MRSIEIRNITPEEEGPAKAHFASQMPRRLSYSAEERGRNSPMNSHDHHPRVALPPPHKKQDNFTSNTTSRHCRGSWNFRGTAKLLQILTIGSRWTPWHRERWVRVHHVLLIPLIAAAVMVLALRIVVVVAVIIMAGVIATRIAMRLQDNTSRNGTITLLLLQATTTRTDRTMVTFA